MTERGPEKVNPSAILAVLALGGGAYALLQQPPRRAGFASGCQAFGHRELLGVLRGFGLVSQPVLTRES